MLKGRKMVTIIDPHIKKDDNYHVYKEAKELGYFIKVYFVLFCKLFLIRKFVLD